MRSIRMFLAVLLIVVLTGALAGCSKKGGKSDESDSETTPTVTGAEGNPTEDPGKPDTKTEASKGLVYAPSGASGYIIAGIGSCEDKHIIIPAFIDDKPVTAIAEGAFTGNLGIERVTLPDSVTVIDKKAFRGCRNLKKVDWSAGLERIGEGAFYGSGLTEVTLPDSVRTVQSSAFAFCEDLKLFRASKGLERIPDYLFDRCTSLETVELNEGLKEIGSNAFDSCESIKTIAIPDSVETIGDSAFLHCSGITSVKLPKNLRTLENLAFTQLTSLREMTIAADAIYFAVSGNCLIEKRTKTVVAVWGGISFPADGSASEIGPFLLKDRTDLASVILPEGITAIQVGAFQGCTGLTNVTFPASLQKIQVSVFEGSGLKELYVPANVTTIYTAAFAATPLTKAEIDGGVSDKLSETFRDCKDLKECRVVGKGVVLADTFSGCAKLTDLTLGGISVIHKDTFSGCVRLKEITFEGTTAEWEAVEKKDGWDNDIQGVKVHCTDGDL